MHIHRRMHELPGLARLLGVEPQGAALSVGVPVAQVRVLVFAEGEAEKLATEAGADFVGADELIKKVEGGWTDFDVALAQREMMGKVGRLGRSSSDRAA